MTPIIIIFRDKIDGHLPTAGEIKWLVLEQHNNGELRYGR